MQVVFERVDAHRYLIGIVRDGPRDVGADVAPRPAPGGGHAPHDLVHFAVEEQLGLDLGVYGQLAAGSDLGGFFRPPPAHRRPAVEQRRNARIGRAGREQIALSERVAALAATGRLADAAGDLLDARRCRAVDERLTELLERWGSVAPGERLVLTWPDRLTPRHGRVSAG